MGVSFSTIFGVNFGFELLPRELVEHLGSSGGIMIDLFIFRIILYNMIEEE